MGRRGRLPLSASTGMSISDLRAVTIPYDIEVQTEWGSNTVHVEPDGVSVTHADCPDHLCVKQGKITSSAIPIACVPHHLTVQIEGTP